MTDKTEDFLLHYGVKGMKWGVRKDRGSSGGSKKWDVRKKRTKKEQRARDQRKAAVKKRRTISDSDLDKMISRLEKEKKLKKLANEDLMPGREQVLNILSGSGEKVARNAVSGVATIAVGAVAAKFFKPEHVKIIRRGGDKK